MAETRLAQAERAYFVRKAGGAQPAEPLNSIKRRVMAAALGGDTSSQTSLKQLEKLWLLNMIGAAATNFSSVGELWRQAITAIGQTGNKKITFYLNAP